jgi:hypothetical protein
VTIADEVDTQLKEQMLQFMAADAAEQVKGKQPVFGGIHQMLIHSNVWCRRR